MREIKREELQAFLDERARAAAAVWSIISDSGYGRSSSSRSAKAWSIGIRLRHSSRRGNCKEGGERKVLTTRGLHADLSGAKLREKVIVRLATLSTECVLVKSWL